MSGLNLPWRRDTCIPYRGVMIMTVEEFGRRFWAYRLPGEWSLRQEFNSLPDAMLQLDLDRP